MPNSDDKKKYFLSVASVVFNADLFSNSNKKFEKILNSRVVISTYTDYEKKYSNIIVYPDLTVNDLSIDRHQELLQQISTSEKNPGWISAPTTNEALGQIQPNIVDANSGTWENVSSQNNALDASKENDPESFKNISDRKITHIIPEVIPGHLQKMGIGQVGHIVLSVVTQQPGETFQYAYQHHKKIFDPRDFGLSAQNIFDDTNCGRYVTAMTIQAAGLVRDGFVINHANLRVSSAVGAALHFNSEEDAKIGLKHAYVKPLSENPTYQEIINHNAEKMKCLKAEYEARKQYPEREYHGTSLFGGYKFASFFARKLGYSATEKFNVIQALEGKDFSELSARDKKIATQGRLGECVKAILKAREQAKESNRNIFEKTNRLGL